MRVIKEKLAKRPIHRLRRLMATRIPIAAGMQAYPMGRLHAGTLILRCAIGGGGLKHGKREGDHASPKGRLRLLDGFYRADKLSQPLSGLKMRPVSRALGWCDDTASGLYNRLIILPSRYRHETLWREDCLYDMIIVLDYNIAPRVKGRGSAIFLHCAKPDFAPTEGCIALQPADLRRLLPRLARGAVLVIR
jgi:L,D-peptidoglycan transpeptidase YkuD (ErfK/YbiS/YcfS/YnhG family)